MEAKNMARQERIGQRTFGIETSQEAPTLLRPKTEKSLIQKLVNNLALRIVLAGGALTYTGYAAYYEIPAVHERLNSLGSGLAERWNSFFGGQTTEESFSIVLPQNGFTPVTPEEKQKLWQNTKTVDLENHTFTIGFPVDQKTIDKSPNLEINSYFDPSLIIGPPSFMQVIEKLKEQGFKNVTQLSGLPKDTQIYYRYDPTRFDASIIAIGIAGVTQGEGSNSFTPAYTNLRVILRDKQSGRNYESTISVLYGKFLITPASYPKDHHPVYEDGTPIKPDEPILQLTTDLQDWDGKTGRPLPGQRGQMTHSAIAGGIDPTTSELLIFSSIFLKTPDGNIAVQQ